MQTIANETNDLPEELVRQVVVQSKAEQVKKLSPMQTYFSLLKGFMSIGILYMPKNTLNGGWLFTLVSMIASFFFTQFALVKLL
jgi:amino acid permease